MSISHRATVINTALAHRQGNAQSCKYMGPTVTVQSAQDKLKISREPKQKLDARNSNSYTRIHPRWMIDVV